METTASEVFALLHSLRNPLFFDIKGTLEDRTKADIAIYEQYLSTNGRQRFSLQQNYLRAYSEHLKYQNTVALIPDQVVLRYTLKTLCAPERQHHMNYFLYLHLAARKDYQILLNVANEFSLQLPSVTPLDLEIGLDDLLLHTRKH